MKNTYSILILAFFIVFMLPAESDIEMKISVEFGFTSILKHEIQSGTTTDKGDLFDYRTQGNQDTLLPFSRFEADLSPVKKHHILFLYQPLTINTQAPISGNFKYGEIEYSPEDGFLDLTYAFNFWRFSYLFDYIDNGNFFLSPGISFQIRNASIVFKASESAKGSVSDNIGPVPILKLKLGYRWDNGVFVLFDGDGFYASNRFFNGAEYPFTGYIYDLSTRAGYKIDEKSSSYINVRFLGGGAEGTNDSEEYTYNDLHTVSLSLGYSRKL